MTIIPLNVDQTFTQAFQVSDKVYQGFIDIFKDKNPLHTDENYARSKKFDGRVMHGNILNGFLSFFIGECLPLKSTIIHSQNITYLKPIYLNDTLTLTVTVDHISEIVGVVDLKFEFTNDKSIKIAKGAVQIGVLA